MIDPVDLAKPDQRARANLVMGPTGQIAVVGAILAIAAAVAQNNGEYNPIGLVFVAIALALATAVILHVRVSIIERHGPQLLRWAIGIAVIIESLLFLDQPVFSTTMPLWIVPTMAFLVVVVTVAVLLGSLTPNKWTVWLLAGALLVFGVVIVRAHAHSIVDVRIFQQGAAQALLQGADPYTVRYRNMYSNDQFYGHGNVDADGWLKAGFIYPPLVAILGIPGVILGDVRFSHLLAMAGAAAALGFARPGRMAIASVALFLLMPRMVYFLAGGWSEAVSVLLLCGTIWAAVRQRPIITGILAGLLIASKQYLLVIVPLLWLLAANRRDRLRIGIAALGAAFLITVPLALWHPIAFFNSVVLFHLRQPFRIDSLSFPAAFAKATGIEPSHLSTIIVIIVICALSGALAYRSPRTPSAFALAVGVVVLGLFAFSHQSFLNYYTFGYAALCAALATSSLEAERDTTHYLKDVPAS